MNTVNWITVADTPPLSFSIDTMPRFTLWKSESLSWRAPTSCLGSGCCPVVWWLQPWLTPTMWSLRTRASPSARSSGWVRRGSGWLTLTAPSSSLTSCPCQRSASLICAFLWNWGTVLCPDTTPRARLRPSAWGNARPSGWWAWWWQRLVCAGCRSVCSMCCETLISISSISATSCSFSYYVTCVQWARPAVTLSSMPGCMTDFVLSYVKCSNVAVASGSLLTIVPQPVWFCEAALSWLVNHFICWSVLLSLCWNQ